MAKKRKKSNKRPAKAKKASGDTVLGSLWTLVEKNPEVALALAFEIGALVSEATRSRGNVKRLLLKQLEKGANLLPQVLASANTKVPPALKLLAAPALQAAIAARSGEKASRQVRRKIRK